MPDDSDSSSKRTISIMFRVCINILFGAIGSFNTDQLSGVRVHLLVVVPSCPTALVSHPIILI